MDISIVIVSFNTEETLKKCLESIFRFTRDLAFEVIVIDNNSNDASAEMVKTYFSQARLIVNITNQGFARAINQGIKMSSGEYILVLNSDILIIDNSIQTLWMFLKAHRSIGVIGPKLLNSDNSLYYSCMRFSSFLKRLWPMVPVLRHFIPQALRLNIKEIDFYLSSQEVDYISGACFMFPRNVLKKLKGLDERFFLYSEEEDFCYRARKHSWKVVYYPLSNVIHIGQASSSHFADRADQQLFYSEFLFFQKHYGRFYALSFRIATMSLMVFKILLYRYLALANRKKAATYRFHEYGCRMLFKAYQPGIKTFI